MYDTYQPPTLPKHELPAGREPIQSASVPCFCMATSTALMTPMLSTRKLRPRSGHCIPWAPSQAGVELCHSSHLLSMYCIPGNAQGPGGTVANRPNTPQPPRAPRAGKASRLHGPHASLSPRASHHTCVLRAPWKRRLVELFLSPHTQHPAVSLALSGPLLVWSKEWSESCSVCFREDFLTRAACSPEGFCHTRHLKLLHNLHDNTWRLLVWLFICLNLSDPKHKTKMAQ